MVLTDSLAFAAAVALAGAYLTVQLYMLSRNLAVARKSGFKYVILPVCMQDIGWLFTQNLFVPILDRLPARWTEKWLPLLMFHRTWNQSYRPFQRMGTDSFMAVSPSRNVLWSSDPELISQVLSRREDFEKPLQAFQLLNIFGPTIAGTGGEQWVRLKKLIGPSFNEKTHRNVWSVSLRIADSMKNSWMEEPIKGHVPAIYKDTARLALHVLTSVCFEKELPWTSERDWYGPVPAGHRMAYAESFATVLDHIREIYFTPPTILERSPLPMHRSAKEAYAEWLQYMEEMCREQREKIEVGAAEDSLGVLETLLGASPKSKELGELSKAEILGNIFVMILAGHETSGNTMSFTMLLLACRPDVQRRLQADLDQVFEGRPEDAWSYEQDLPKLLNGYTGAVVRETLRLYAPIPFLLRERLTGDFPLTVRDEKYVVPQSTTLFMNVTAAQRNPAYWKEKQPADAREARFQGHGEQGPYPITNFVPDRWLDSGFQVADGSFLPFSEGQRACLGRRFSMVEMCAVIARVFHEYSVELDVEETEDGRQEKSERGHHELEQKWRAAREKAERELSEGIKFIVTLKMTGRVALKFVKRGQERFLHL